MIYWNGNEYRTLDQKLYYGGTQIAKAYWGNQLVYPEKKQEENIINGHKLEGIRLGGNVYDTGIAPTRGTTVEICFENKQDTIGSNGFPIFGTHQDIYYAFGGTESKYNPSGDNTDEKRFGGQQDDFSSAKIINHTVTYYKMGDWGNGKSHNNCFNWKNQTSFHFIIKRIQSSTQSSDYLYARYGGISAQGFENSLSTYTNNNLTADYVHNTNYNTTKDDNILKLGYNFFNSDIDKTDSATNTSIKGKFFTFRVERQRTIQKKIYSEEPNLYDINVGKIYIGQGVGSLYYGNNNLYIPNKIFNSGNDYIDTNVNFIKNINNSSFSTKKSEGYDVKGGNLWIGSMNRNFSSSTDAVSPNPTPRNHIRPNAELTKESFQDNCSDLNQTLFQSGDLEWVYVIIEDRDENGNLKTISGKPVKYLFMPEKTTIIDSGNDYYVIFKRYPWNITNNKFEDNPDTIILPFMKCAINNS